MFNLDKVSNRFNKDERIELVYVEYNLHVSIDFLCQYIFQMQEKEEFVQLLNVELTFVEIDLTKIVDHQYFLYSINNSIWLNEKQNK